MFLTANNPFQFDVPQRFRRDAQRAVRNHINRVPMEILLPPLKQHVLQPCLALLAPLEAAIPEPVKDFISIARVCSCPPK